MSDMIGASPAFLSAMERMRKLAGTLSTVLLTGETGVGKEKFAEAIHALREKPGAPFVAVNCGAISAALLESELLGYERGAFSGADPRGKPGKIELARGGTLFLDEIGELPPDLQVKLLRILEERSYYPVGGTRLHEADCRFVAATNRDLREAVREGRFREDLYYRINAIALDVPPLRERREDIPLLAAGFLETFSLRYGRPVPHLTGDILSALHSYDWPGNIRELRNAMESLVVFSENGRLRLDDLPAAILRRPDRTSESASFPVDPWKLPESGGLAEWMADIEGRLIGRVLAETGGNKQAAAKRLGISRVALYKKLERNAAGRSKES